MKLDHDCIRNFLLYSEDELTLDSYIEQEKIEAFALSHNYSIDNVTYTILRLIEAGFIKVTHDMSGEYMVTSITWEGHQFLDTIRDDKVWKNTKSAVSTLASVSLPVLAQIATAQLRKILGLS